MRRSLSMLFAVVIALGSAYSANAQIQSNLINNAGFEDALGFDFSDTSNWNGFFGGPAGTFLEAFNDTGAAARSGAQSLELTLDGNDGSINGGPATNGFEAFVGHVQTVSAVPENEDFIYSVFARNNGSTLTGVTEFRIEFRDSSNAEISRTQIDLQTLLTDSFEEFQITGTTPAGTDNVNLVIALSSANQDVFHSNSVLFDDTSFGIVQAIPEPTSAAFIFGLGSLMVVRRRRS